MVTGGLTPRAAVALVQQRLAAAGCPDADFDARELFRLATGRDPRLSERVLTKEQAARLETLCQRRESREPLQYLCGRWPFLDFELAVGPGVLCPRADTEVVAEAAAQTLAGCAAPKVLDLCAGTGCLGLGIKRLCPTASVTCVEKSPEALHYLVCNVRTALRSLPQGSTEDVLEEDEPTLGSGLLGIAALPPAAQAVEGDLFDYWRGLPEGGLDLIVSNPPYLTASEMEDLQPEVAKEPAMALAAGEDGLDFYRALARHYQTPLRPGGTLALEIGWQQREAVCALLQAEGWTQIRCIQDLGGNDRCILAQRPEERSAS
jgi:release factor glutamine methyltransferase